MSEQKKIVEDLFQQQRNKKQKNQKAKPAATGATAQTGKKKDSEDKKEDTQVISQTQSQQQDFAESSDEETKIELDEKTAVIKDAKEVEALKRKENEKDQQAFGWAGLDKKAQAQATSAPAKQKPAEAQAATKASGGIAMDMDSLKASATSGMAGKPDAGIKFKQGPQTFTKSKNAMNQQEFPAMGENSGAKKSDDANFSKKDSTSIGHFGAAFSTGKPKEPKEGGQQPAEEPKEAKMPVFTRKIKVTTDDSQNVENIPKQQSYDFSKMKMSHASSKPAGPRLEGEHKEHDHEHHKHEQHHERDGDRPTRGTRGGFGERGRGRGGFDRSGGDHHAKPKDKENSDDSFEEVKEKRKPQFSRGGKNFAQM